MTDETAPSATPKSRARLIAVVAAVAVVVLALAGIGTYFATAPSAITVTGALELSHRGGLAGYCDSGMDGYDDLRSGTQIIVSDAAGKTLAIGHLSDGTRVANTVCSYRFSISDVPGGEDFYGIEVARRGRVQYARADLDKPLRLTVG